MDIKTVLQCLFVIDLFMGVYTFIIKKTQPTFDGINYWIWSNFAIATGYLLVSERVQLSSFLSIILAQALFLLGAYLRIFGLILFFKVKRNNYRKALLYLGGIAYLLLLTYFTYAQDNIFIRTTIIGLVLSGISFYIGFLILSSQPAKGRYAYVFTAITFFTFSTIFLVRIFMWIFFPSMRGLFVANFINDLQFVSSLVIDISWTTMFFVIHNQRLTNQLQESEEKFRAIFTQNS